MADRKRSHVWLYFSCKDSSDAVCDVCGKTVKYSGNTTNLAKHLRLSHKSEYDDIMKRRSEEVQGEKKQGARARQTAEVIQVQRDSVIVALSLTVGKLFTSVKALVFLMFKSSPESQHSYNKLTESSLFK